jgi:hypothetical protein
VEKKKKMVSFAAKEPFSNEIAKNKKKDTTGQKQRKNNIKGLGA